VIAGGLLLVGAGSVTAAAGLSGGRPAIAAWAALAGLGLGAASVAATTLGASAVPEAERGTAAALLNAAAQLGTGIGVPALVLLAGTTGATAGHRLGFLAAALLAVIAAGAAQVTSGTKRTRSRQRRSSSPPVRRTR
jgi:MFS family permease